VAAGSPVVRVHPQQPGRLIAASDSVFESPDGGNTWRQLIVNPVEGDGFYDLEFLPASPWTLFGVTYRNGVYRSDDGGVSWQQRSSGLDLKHVFASCRPQLEIDPRNPRVMYALLASRKAFKTTDGGDNWLASSKGMQFQGEDEYMSSATALAIDPHNPTTLFAGGHGHMFRTTDGAVQWNRLGELSACDISIDHINANTVYACGPPLNKTTDGGESWQELTIDSVLADNLFAVAVDPANGKSVVAGSWGGGIFRTIDSGKRWTETNRGVDGSDLQHLAACPAGKGLLVAQGGQLLYRSRDSGRTWDVICPSMLAYGDLQVHPKDANLLVAAGGFGSHANPLSVALSTDGGTTWDFTGLPAKAEDQRTHRVALDPVEKDTMYVSAFDNGTGQGMGAAKSTDRGQTWRFINSGLGQQDVTAIAVDPVRRTTIYAGTSSGKVFKTTNGGARWKESSAGLAGGRAHDLAVDPTHPDKVYFAGSTGTCKSSDGGRTWVRTARDAACVMVHPRYPRTLFVGRWGEIAVSTDEGETWSAFDMTGLGPCDIADLVVDPANPEGYFAATARGVFSYTRKGSPGGPLIQQLLPATGKAGDTVTVNGSGFGTVQGSSTVQFGSMSAGTAQVWSGTSIKVTVPAGVRTGYVTVTVFGKKSNRYEFIVLPASGSVEPTSGPPSGGTRVTILSPEGISGSEFNVLFGSSLAGNVRFMQPNIITCDSPPGTGTVEVKVSTALTTTTVGTFTYE